MAYRLLPLLIGACFTLTASRVRAVGEDWSEFERESERFEREREQRAQQHAEQKAHDAVVHFADRPVILEVSVGLYSPIGLLGAQATYSPFEQLAVSVGGGVDVGGLQLGASLRGRVLVWNRRSFAQALVLMPAFHVGHFLDASLFGLDIADSPPEEDPPDRIIDRAKWLHAWAGYELRLRGGLNLLAAGGFAYLLNPNDCREATAVCEPVPDPFVVPSYGLFAGYSF